MHFLSSVQKEIWLDQALHPGAPLYNIGGYTRIDGSIDPELLKQAICGMVREHDSLRTILHEGDPFPGQEFPGDIDIHIPLHDFSREPAPHRQAEEWMKREFTRPFDLYGAPLFRYALIKLSVDRYYWFFCYHHLVTDGWGIYVVIRRLAHIYNELLKENRHRGNGQPSFSYHDFIRDERRYLESEKFTQHRQFWLDKYAVLPEPVIPRRHAAQFNNRVIPSGLAQLWLDRGLYNSLSDLAKANNATIFHVMLAALYCYFLRTSPARESGELVIGLPVLGRSSKAFKQTSGVFSRVMPVRFQLGMDLSLAGLIKAIRSELRQYYRYQQFPISEINRLCGVQAQGRRQLFDITFSFETFDFDTSLNGSPIEVVTLLNGFEQTPLAIFLRQYHEDLDIRVDFSYNLAAFDEHGIQAIIDRFPFILEQFRTNPAQTVREMPIMPEAERRKLINHWNRTRADYPRDRRIHRLFREQALKTPGAVALIGKNRHYLTYQELDIQSTRLAHRLAQKGAGPGTIVAIKMEQSADMVIVILGILKSGAAYLPIDPDYPPQRIRYMLTDSAAPILVTGEENIRVIRGVHPSPGSGGPPAPGDTAYVIYTSGSTGKPKGVMVEHRNVLNTLTWFMNTFRIDINTRVIQLTNYIFDPSVEQIFGALLRGAGLFLGWDSITTNPETLYRYLERERIDIINTVPAMLELLLVDRPKLKCIRTVISGGEALKNTLKEHILEKGYDLYNLYGPTETTIESLAWKCSDQEVNLGAPIANMECYILDTDNGLLPVGVPGEICISGAGVARGYLNNPQLTAERFLPHPFQKGKRLYKTGDTGFRLPDGNISFSGRIDQQIKIRGFRIELGEIEYHLLNHPGIKEAVVITYTTGEQDQLAAFIVVADKKQPSGVMPAENWREYLSNILPAYMIPHIFIKLEKLPLTATGKTDRNTLATLAADSKQEATRHSYVPPGNKTEERLARIWEDVLGVERIGINENFFLLGGHSLSAAQVVSKLYKELSVEIKLRDIFEAPTVAGLAQILKPRGSSRFINIHPVEEREYYELSHAQRRLWILCQFEQAGAAYTMPAAYVLRGELNVPALNRAFSRLTLRHESLRTCFKSIGGQPGQIIQKQVTVSIRPVAVPAEQLENRLAGQAAKVFDLSRAPLFEVKLFQTDPRTHILLFNLHHIIADGWSLDILTHELATLYNAFATSSEPGIPQLPIQYKDYAAWQKKTLREEKINAIKAYWRQVYPPDSEIPVLDLPRNYPRPAVRTYHGGSVRRVLDHRLTSAVHHLCQQQEVTLFMFLLAAVDLLLYRYTGQEDIITGTPAAGRDHPVLKDQVGFYVNTLALRRRVNGDDGFDRFLQQVKQTASDAYENQSYPFDRLVDELNLPGDTGRHPLFDVMLVLQNTRRRPFTFDALEFAPIEHRSSTSKFDVTFNFMEEAGEIVMDTEYDTALFEPDQVERLCTHFVQLTRNITAEPRQKLHHINLLTEKEKQRLLIQFNSTQSPYPTDKTLTDLFEEQVEKTPDRIALTGETYMSYKELDRQSLGLAHLLRQKGIRPGSIVAIKMAPSIEMIAAIMGILKAGCAYLPIDPDYPQKRIDYILNDSAAMMLVPGENRDGISTREPLASPDSAAYVIYTSGSSGKPKGVIIDHSSVINLVTALNRAIYSKYPTPLRVALMASYTFDASVQQVFASLLNGHQLVIIDPKSKTDTDSLSRFLVYNKIQLSDGTPSLLALMSHALESRTKNHYLKHYLKHLVIGGEALSTELLDTFYQNPANRHVVITNIYGPTESTVDVSYFDCSFGTDNIHSPIVPIGKPLSNIKLYVLDRHRQLSPMGVPGEICIAGAGLARGYLNNPQLTRHAFIPHPFNEGERMYKTGDLGAWMPCGNIKFLGRIDDQVKVRGYRIELGEIQFHLLNHPHVQDAVVIAYPVKGQNQLAAFVVIANTHESTPGLPVNLLKDHLNTLLPGYMIPSLFVKLDSIPLNSSGKADLNALARLAADSNRWAVDSAYTPPGNAIEEKLVEIWQDVLGVERIGINDIFFQLGGHSLKAIRIVSEIYRELSVELPLSQIFKHPTIAGISRIINRQDLSEFTIIDPVEEREYYGVSHAQRRLWILCQFEEERISYNMPAAFSLLGKLDTRALNQACKALIRRHESLRTCFVTVHGVPVQVVRREVDFEVRYKDTRDGESVKELARRHAAWVFDLSKAPLFKATLLHTGEHRHVILFNMHHIIADGWSAHIIIKDIMALYNAFSAPTRGVEGSRDPRSILPPLSIQYKDYALWQKQTLQEEKINAVKAYWYQAFPAGEDIPVLDLPADYPRPADRSYHGDSIHWVLDHATASALNHLCHRQEVTLFMGLLAAVNILIYRYTGQEDIIIGSPTAGRDHPRLEKQVGFYVNTLPLRHRLKGNETAEAFLRRVKQTAGAAFENQVYPFDRLVDELNPSRDTNRHPLFDVMVVLQNTGRQELKLENIEAAPMDNRHYTSKFDLTFDFAERGGDIHLVVEFSTGLFKKDRIRRLCIHLTQLIKSITHNPKQEIQDLGLLTQQEKHQLLVLFNDTSPGNPVTKTIPALFKEQAQKTPDATALSGNNRSHRSYRTYITYKELDRQATLLARQLTQKGVKPETIVSVKMERSIEMIIALLGILNAGGAYLPVDPEYPRERIDYMLKDSNAKLLLGAGDVCPEDEQAGSAEPLNRLPVSPSNLAYVMYTSGSTGRPKGIEIEHKSLANYVSWARSFYLDGKGSGNFGLYSPLTFDLTITSIYCPLTSGAGLYIYHPSEEIHSVLEHSFHVGSAIDCIKMTPSHINILESLHIHSTNIKTVIVGGEELTPGHVGIIKNISPAIEVVNEYGPTETTVGCIIKTIETGETPILIGKPITGTKVHILCGDSQLLPIGIPGEIYISGVGVARGYLNNPELTNKKFLGVRGERFYKTGDLGRWLPDGNIEFLGRRDGQVKIRGFRIELAGIETRLLGHPLISEAAVIVKQVKPGHQNELLAFIVSPAGDVEKMDLREHLGRFLPAYMIPHHFVQLDRLPLTPNGKTDKKALGRYQLSHLQFQKRYTPPANETEQLLADIWREVLGRERIGVNDNFFEIGGDSIKAIQIASRAYQHGFKLEIKTLFKHPVIRELAKYTGKVQRKPRQETVTGEAALTPIQKWFFERRSPDPGHFNQSVLLYRKERFNKDFIEKCVNVIIRHHDALRMIYSIKGERVTQQNRGADSPLFHLESSRFTSGGERLAGEIEREANRVQRGIDLENGPLVKLALFETRQGDHLLIVIHHLVIDGVSWRILLEDFKTAYRQLENGKDIRLREKTDSFQYWAKKQLEYGKSKKLHRQLANWKTLLDTKTAVLPKDMEAPDKELSFEDNETVSLSFTRQRTVQLLERTHRAYNTHIDDLLLTALALSLQKTMGMGKILVNLEGHGREEIMEDVDINRTIGWFTTHYPVVLDMEKYHDLSYRLRYIKETLGRIPGKGSGFGILKYLSPFKEELAAYDMHGINFNYLGEFGREIGDGEGLFRFSEFSAGNPVCPAMQNLYLLDINGILIDGTLRLHFGYNKNQYRESTIKRIAGAYQSALIEIIDHCVKRERRQFTPGDYGYHRLSLENLDKISAAWGGSARIDKIYPLSPMQEGLLFHWLMDKDSSAYFEQFTFHLDGIIDPAALEKSINLLTARHDILRTAFIYKHIEAPAQVVLKEREIQLEYHDLATQNKEIESFRSSDKKRGFDLTRDPLMRFTLLKLNQSSHVLIWSHHHILMDGWCISIFFKELFTIYRSLIKNQTLQLEPAVPFKHYIDWLETQDKEDGLKYWEDVLEGYDRPVSPPKPGLSLSAGQAPYRLEEYRFQWSEEETSRVLRAASLNQVTFNTLFQTLWAILLMRYNNTRDVVFGAVVSGRHSTIDGIEHILGLFVNTIPVRIQTFEDQTFDQLLKKVQEQALHSKNMEYLPLSEIQSKSPLKGDLIDHITGFENYPFDEELKSIYLKDGFGPGFRVKHVEVEEQTNYDLNLIAAPADTLTFRFSYNANVYSAELIERITGHFNRAIRSILSRSPGGAEIKVKDIQILPDEEKHRLITDFNDTAAAYPGDRTIVDLFEEQVEKYPHRAALVNSDASVTYGELNRRANQVANYLNDENPLFPDQPAGLLMDRGIDMMTAIIGILKAGGSYVPILPSFPEERAKHIIDDSAMHILIGEKQYIKTLNRLLWECRGLDTILCIDSENIRGEEEAEENRLMSRKLWEYVGETSVDEIGGGGWNSSYTGLPISKEEMDEYGDNILKKLEPLLHKDMRVLEIGAASGISMFRIAPKTGFYYGTDLSRVIIEKNRRRVKDEGHQNIKLRTLAAHDIHRLKEKEFDLVIINSVIQCFNGHNYLEKVIRKAIRLMRDGSPGYLFIGDIMDLDKKNDLAADLAAFKRANKNKNYKTKANLSEELFISRSYLEDLVWDIPEIQDVKFSGKIHTLENELTRFRYDALIYIDKNGTSKNKKEQRHKHRHDLTHLRTFNTGRLNTSIQPGNLVYIIYTSGSSGKPKGVLIPHGGLVNTAWFCHGEFRITPRSRISQVSSASFDAMSLETWPCLTAGAALCIVDDETRMDHARMKQWLSRYQITLSFQSPYIAQQLLETRWPESGAALEVLQTGGDRLTAYPPRPLPFRFYNLYGPTEDSILTTWTEIPFTPAPDNTPPPIGKPLANKQIYILSPTFELQPIDVAGELYIAGDGLARGYLNQPDLTNKKFLEVQKPFFKKVFGPRRDLLYRTGDQARWRADGNIDFLGRVDRQVKIRGYRIELEEIEHRLLEHDAIKEAVVLRMEKQVEDVFLCAYIVSEKSLDNTGLREFLLEHLPVYMAPAYFVMMKSLPLNPSGKIDKKALPDPVDSALMNRTQYAPARDEVEDRLVETWETVLGRKPIGIDENFFEIGGDSIKAIQIISRAYKYGIKIEIKDLFKYPVIKELSGHARKVGSKPRQETVTGEVKLTPIQRWFFDHNVANPDHFTQTVMLYKENRFDGRLVEACFKRLITHHDALRMVIEFQEDRILQQNRGVENPLFDIDILHPKGNGGALAAEVAGEAKRVQRSIHIDTGPLVKLTLFKTDRGDHLLIVTHHLVMDGISWRILLEDFSAAYEALENNEAIQLQDKTHSFQYWGERLDEYARSSALKRELATWKHITANQVPPLPRDTVSREAGLHGTETVALGFTPGQTGQLLEHTNQAYNTGINDLLLTALALSMQRMWGLEKIRVNLEGHGRENIIKDADISRTIGWFTTQFPVLLDISKYDSLSRQIRWVKETLRRIPNKGIGFGVLRYLSPYKEQLSSYREPDIMFNYMGEFGQELQPDHPIFTFSPLNTENADLFSIRGIFISGISVKKTLSIHFRYNTDEYEQETIERLAHHYRSALLEIIDHCAGRERPRLTPSDYGCPYLSLENLDTIGGTPGIDHNVHKLYPLSPMQEGFLFHWLLDNRSKAYFEQHTLYLDGKIDPEVLEKSINLLIARHDILRTAFIYQNIETPLQVVLKERRVPFLYASLSSNPHPAKPGVVKDHIIKLREADKKRGFHLTEEPLMRFALIKAGETAYVLIWSHHHILMDGWCTGIFFKELFIIYRSLLDSHPIRLEPAVPYRHYIQWLEKRDKEEGLQYWERYLEGYDRQAGLPPLNHSAAAGESGYKLARYRFEIAAEETARLNQIAAQNQVTINTMVQVLWAIPLMRWNNAHDVVFGSVVSGRSAKLEGIERILGLFINTVPVRVQTTPQHTFTRLIEEVQEHALQARTREFLPLSDIQSRSRLKTGLINHIIIFENYPIDEELMDMSVRDHTPLGFKVSHVEVEEQTNYDFNIMVLPGKTLSISFNYNSNVYHETQVTSIANHLQHLVKVITTNPGQLIKNIEILPSHEKHLLLETFNQTATPYPHHRTIIDLFDDQVQRTPDAIALTGNNRSYNTRLTYKELHLSSARLSQELREKGIHLESIVAIKMERSPELVAAILAILKAGGAYLPIDPAYPSERIDYILSDSAAALLITSPGLLSPLERGARRAGCVELGGPTGQDIPNPSNLAYVIYTSGSTGKPKGVMIEHRNVTGFNVNLNHVFNFKSSDVIYALTTITFDISVLEILCCLMSGIQTVLSPSSKIQGILSIEETIVKERISVLQITPTNLMAIIDFTGPAFLDRLRVLLIGGEPLPARLFNIVKNLKNTSVFNVYGPTEATIWSTARPLNNGDPNIGVPLCNESILIISKDRRLMPIGAAGEICIGGNGVGRGYLNAPGLTRERFIPHPFKKGDIVYKTGDSGYWLPDGNIHFLGRTDGQVKIRGFRIEVGEIEHHLSTYPGIKETAVTAKNSGDQVTLAAYFVCQTHQKTSKINAADLRNHLARFLPEYMIPAYFVPLDHFPVTANGKTDKKALPDPIDASLTPGSRYIPPGNRIEEKLLKIWQTVLGRDKIGIDDNFFEAGGNSLKIIRIAGLLMAGFDADIPVARMFEYTTIRAFARYLARRPSDAPGKDAGEAPIAPSKPQKRSKLNDRKKRLKQQPTPPG
jgi:amino acid adenylation domain-containing protein/non-ribosomal peptide synthase protein (TIGR01720 family)